MRGRGLLQTDARLEGQEIKPLSGAIWLPYRFLHEGPAHSYTPYEGAYPLRRPRSRVRGDYREHIL